MADLTSDINLDVASPPPKKLRTSSVSSAGDIDKFVNLFSEGCPAQGDYFRSVLVFSEDKYVVTQSYRELRKKVNSALKSMERKTITLRGPEGVGKGMTLAAVASEYSKEKPCVLWSPTHGTQSTFCAALKEVYRQFGKEMEFSDNVQDIDLVRGLANIFPNRCIVLIELGSVTELDAKVQQSLVDIMSIGSVKLFVISLSSGAGGRGFPCNTLHTFKKQMMKIKAASHVNFVSFTEAEADVLLSDTDKYPLEQEFYYGLTNYNPGLLSLCAGCGGESEAEQNVQQQVRFFVDAIKKSLEVDKYFWLKSSLETSMRMLSYAYNCEMIPQERLREYESTWLKAENLTCVVEQSEGFFKLAVNYPSIYDMLLSMFQELAQELGTSHISNENSKILQGLSFKAHVCASLKEISVCCYGRRGGSQLQTTFRFNFHKNYTWNKQLTKGVLYRLRPFHPVIDAVGYTEDSDGEPWLLLIQVSLSNYKANSTKVEDLLDNTKGREKRPQGCESWLCYFSDGIELDQKDKEKNKVMRMYIYLSPEKLMELGDMSDVCSILDADGQLSHLPDFFCGLVSRFSPTAYFLSKKATEAKNLSL